MNVVLGDKRKECMAGHEKNGKHEPRIFNILALNILLAQVLVILSGFKKSMRE